LQQTGFLEKLRIESVIFITFFYRNVSHTVSYPGWVFSVHCSGALIDCGWCIPGHVHVGQPAGVTPENIHPSIYAVLPFWPMDPG
jgi:hypothetical protein